MRIISISGLDGSGKSTQINLLKIHLESQGKRVFYFHAIHFGTARRMTNFLEIMQPNKNLGGKKEFQKSVTKSNKLGIALRKILLQIDIFRFKKLARKLRKEGYNYILTDRYFYDSIVNIEYLEKTCHPELVSGSQEMPKQVRHDKINKPDIAIYLQTDPEIIMQRERKPDQGIEYLQKKKVIYDNCAKIWNLRIINGNRSEEEIFGEIKNFI